jgi:hypothetical protein
LGAIGFGQYRIWINIYFIIQSSMSRDSVASIATGSLVKGLEFGSLYAEDFSPLHVIQAGSGDIEHLIQSVLVVKLQGRGANHWPPTSDEVKNSWSYTFTPPICLHGVVLNELRTGTNLPTFHIHIAATATI